MPKKRAISKKTHKKHFKSARRFIKPAARLFKKIQKRTKSKKSISKKDALVLLLLAILFLTIWFVVYSVSQINKVEKLTLESSSSEAYTKQDILAATSLGTIKQLKSEIKGWDRGHGDLHVYMIKDYKQLKKQCVVNGTLTGEVGYELVNMTYNSYAVIKKDCNGLTTEVLKKFDKGWTVVYSGNTLISCELVNSLNIPQPISYNCQYNGTVYVNPNQ